jgi:plasmid stability protein
MASLTIHNLPDDLLGRLQAEAAKDRRSLDRELILLLESALSARRDAEPSSIEAEAEAQYQAWCRLGTWQSDRSAADEIRDILSRRTLGRPVEL